MSTRNPLSIRLYFVSIATLFFQTPLIEVHVQVFGFSTVSVEPRRVHRLLLARPVPNVLDNTRSGVEEGALLPPPPVRADKVGLYMDQT
jgi:hypothetical protein